MHRIVPYILQLKALGYMKHISNCHALQVKDGLKQLLPVLGPSITTIFVIILWMFDTWSKNLKQPFIHRA